MKTLNRVLEDGSRVSGTGGFPPITQADVGRKVVVTRTCITWDGCLGYFADDKKQVTHAFHLGELEGLIKHEDSITKIKIGKKDVNELLITNYISHFDADKADIEQWEYERKALHNKIFNAVGITRVSDEGIIFSKALDEYCIPLIEKTDYMAAALKAVSSASNNLELRMAEVKLNNAKMRKEYEIKRRD